MTNGQFTGYIGKSFYDPMQNRLYKKSIWKKIGNVPQI